MITGSAQMFVKVNVKSLAENSHTNQCIFYAELLTASLYEAYVSIHEANCCSCYQTMPSASCISTALMWRRRERLCRARRAQICRISIGKVASQTTVVEENTASTWMFPMDCGTTSIAIINCPQFARSTHVSTKHCENWQITKKLCISDKTFP